jgi:hypothetical protein
MKIAREHRVSLSTPAMAILRELRAQLDHKLDPAAFVFPSRLPGKPLSNMALLATLKRMGRDDLIIRADRGRKGKIPVRLEFAENGHWGSIVDSQDCKIADGIAIRLERAYRPRRCHERRPAWRRWLPVKSARRCRRLRPVDSSN